MTMSSTHPSRGPSSDGIRDDRVLPVTRDLTLAYALSLLVAVLMAVVSVAGPLFGSRGLYGLDSRIAAGVTTGPAGLLVPGFLAQDALNLVVGLPVLLGSLWLARRGTLIGLLLWPGALFSVLYTYVHYLVGAPFSGLFLPHVALVAVSGFTTIGVVASLDGEAVRQRLARAVPARAVGGTLVALALLTIAQDVSGAIVSALANVPPIDTAALSVWVGDLTLGAPATLIGGVLLCRRAALGYVIGAGLLLSFGVTPVELAAMLALQPQLTASPIDLGTITGLLIFAAVPLALLAFFLRGSAGEQGVYDTVRAGSMSPILRGVAVWFCIIFVEVLHGIARTMFLSPAVGDFRARQVAVFTGSFLILVVAMLFIRWIRPADAGEAMSIGIVWLVLTLAFEIAFGRYVVQASWSRIASDYNLFRGGLLPIGLFVLTAAPLIAARFRRVL